MTYIEFFDKTQIENICSSLISQPERVILIGDKLKLLQKHADRFASILEKRGQPVEFLCRAVNKNDISDVIDVLSSIVEEYDDCVFDLTGGEDVLLVASGIVFERYRDRNIQMHRINIRSNKIQDCDLDGVTVFEGDAPCVSVEENVRIYGGDIVYGDRAGATPRWNMNDDFAHDIDVMWEICRQDVRRWNAYIGIFKLAEELGAPGTDELSTVAAFYLVKERMKGDGWGTFKDRIIDDLGLFGLAEVTRDYGLLTIKYKNPQVKKVLTKEGQILEMKIYLTALRAQDNEAEYTYNDVMNGVSIDWDGEIHTEPGAVDTKNEIDVMMMRGLVPVFVSCKNGLVDINELYKLNTVAERFGGRYAKKVLVATALDSGASDDYIRVRAKDMGIRIIDDAAELDEAGLLKTVKSFWRVS